MRNGIWRKKRPLNNAFGRWKHTIALKKNAHVQLRYNFAPTLFLLTWLSFFLSFFLSLSLSLSLLLSVEQEIGRSDQWQTTRLVTKKWMTSTHWGLDSWKLETKGLIGPKGPTLHVYLSTLAVLRAANKNNCMGSKFCFDQLCLPFWPERPRECCDVEAIVQIYILFFCGHFELSINWCG